MNDGVLALVRPAIRSHSTPMNGRAGGSPTEPRRLVMTHFTLHTPETAPAESRPLLESIGRSFGFVPNLFGVFAESPAALRGALAVYEAFAKSSLSPVEQQL